MEFDFFARDEKGNLALFSTAGIGHVLWEVIERDTGGLFLKSFLPKIGEGIDIVDRAVERYKQFTMPEEFMEFAASGLYIFNHSCVYNGDYIKIVRPSNPLNFEDLEDKINLPDRDLTLLDMFPLYRDVDFEKMQTIPFGSMRIK
jgi:hypothetical protein